MPRPSWPLSRPLWTLPRVTGTLAIGLILGLSGCSPVTGGRANAPTLATCTRHPEELRLNLATEPPTLDPTRMTDLTSFQIYNLLMRGLTRPNHDGQPVPALALSWQLLDGGKTYRFALDPMARWSDGQPVTAQQFIDGWQRALDPKGGNPYAFLLFDVVNARAFHEGNLKQFDTVGIRALNPYTLEIRLDHPVAYFLQLTGFPTAMPVRLDVLTRYGAKATEAGHFVGTGPFILTEWKHDSHLVVTPNPFSRERPRHLKRVHLAMIADANTALGVYQQGGLDLVDTLPQLELAQLAKRPDAHRQTMNAIFYLGFNTKKPPFTDARVRQAFGLAVDRRQLLAFLQKPDAPLKGLLPPGMTGHDPAIGLDFDPARARRLLAEAGYPGGKGLPEVTLGFPSRFELRREAEVLQYFWQQHLGVRVRLASTEWKQYLQQLSTDPPGIFRESWYADYPDPDTFASLFTSYQGSNHTGWQEPTYDAGVQKAARESNPQRRQVLYGALQRQILEQATALVPLYASTKVWLAAPYVEGAPINRMNEWHLQTTRLTSCNP